MKNLKKHKNITLLLCLFLTICFPSGILMIIFGFSENGSSFVGIIGIILTVLGFYVMPISWIKYGDIHFAYKIHQMITLEKLRNITVISQSVDKSKKDITKTVKYLISGRYLVGLLLIDDEYIVENQQNANIATADIMSGVLITRKCPMCGASSQMPKTASECPYCGYILSNQDKEGNA